MLELSQVELPMLSSDKTSEIPTGMPNGMPTGAPVGAVTFLFTDIEGSTKLWESYPQATGEALAQHDKLLQSSIKYHGGHVFKSTGDGFCAAFSTAANALEAALDSQYSLHKEKWPEPIEEIKVRMANHSGTADTRDGDYFGPPLNRVARMESVAHGGQIILSQAARRLLGNDLPTNVDLIDLGTYHLRSLQQPEKIYQAASPNLQADIPPILTEKKGRSNLPSQPTSFIGRNTELEQIIKLIDQPDCRLLTLVGPGGIGKTRLALHVADQRLDYYPHGIYFVPLAPLSSSEYIIPTIADGNCRIGFAALGLGKLDEAREYFPEAFDRALIHKMVPSALYALAGMACVLAQKGQEELAAETIFFVLKNPGIPAIFKALIAPYFAELEESAEPGLMARLEEKAEQKLLEDFASIGLRLEEMEKIN